MSRRVESRQPTTKKVKAGNTSLTGNIVCAQKSKELSELEYEGEKILYVEHEGMKLYPVHVVGEKYGYSSHDALQAFQSNLKFLEGNHYRLKLRLYHRTVSVPCLTGEGVLIYTARLGIGKIPEDRQLKVIRTVQFMAKAAMGVIEQAALNPKSSGDWRIERQKAATNWNRLCEALKIKVVPTLRDQSHERFVYINEAKMLNKNVYGRHQKGIRDRSTYQQIEALENAEAWDTAFLHLNITDKEKRDALIDGMLIRHYPDLDLERVLPEPVTTLKITARSGQRVLIEFQEVV